MNFRVRRFFIFIFKTHGEMKMGRRCCNYLQSWARDNVLASRQRQRNNVIEPRGQEKIRKILSSRRCLHGVAKTNIVKMQNPRTLRPENMVTFSRQFCRVPSSENQCHNYL